MPDNRRRKSRPVVQPLLRRLDDAAENLNPVLLLIIIGLVILNFSVFAALELRQLPLRVTDAHATPFTLGQAVGQPQR